MDALQHLNPEMGATLRERKEEGKRDLKRSDFVWHLLLQSFSTLGGSRDWPGLMDAMENYNRVTFEALSRLDAMARIRELQEVFRAAEVRYADTRARLMSKYYDLVTEMGGLEEARTRVRARGQAKIGFMKRLPGVGDK